MKFKQKYFSIIPVLILYLVLSNCSCSEDNPVVPPPPPDKEQFVKLSTLTVTCTEAFIKVSVNDTLLPLNITLSRDDSPVFSFNLTKNDTTIIDTNLSPGGSYNYTAAAVINGEEWTGNRLQVQTLALTSHNFTWQKYTFGDGASSILRDVAIIDENNIWAVGEIYMNDSTGQPDPLPYNAAHWDGSQWELKRILYGGGFWTIRTIFAFNENDIWFSAFVRYDGQNFIELPIPQILMGWSIKKIWGSSSNDLYVVGNGGNIAHYQNGSWSKIESGIELNIIDIWGDTNPFTNKTEIICGAANIFVNPGSELIRIKEDLTTEILDKTGLGQTFAPLWFKAGIRYYVVGDGLYEKTYKDTSSWKDLNSNSSITQYFMECIRGSALNNIIVAGAFGEVIHFNGISWESIKNAETTLNNGSYYKVAVKGNIVVTVGFDQNQAVILLGHN